MLQSATYKNHIWGLSMPQPNKPLLSLRRSWAATDSHWLSDEDIDEMIATWLRYGHDKNTIQKQDGYVAVTINSGTVLHVRDGEISFHGEVTDDAIAAGMRHAQEAWGGRMYIYGSEDFKLRNWAMAQVAGVEIGNYSPPPHLMERADHLLRTYAVEMFNRGIGAHNDGTLGGPKDDRPWGYRARSRNPETFERDNERFRRRGFNPEHGLI
jgi:hypothetical protein